MRNGPALLVRGIWWRRWASLVVVLCASITVAAAAAGPIWGRAAQASLLARTLDRAPPSSLAWTTTGDTDAYGGLSVFSPSPSAIRDDVRAASALPPDLDGLFDAPTEMVGSLRRLQVLPADPRTPPAGATAPAAEPARAALVGREGACGQVQLVSGGCPASPADVLLSDRSAAELGVGAGDRILLPDLVGTPLGPGRAADGTLTVSGVYRVDTVRTTSRLWFGGDVLAYVPGSVLAGETVPTQLDAVLVEPALILSLSGTPVLVQRERALRPGAVTLENADRLPGALYDTVLALDATTRLAEASATAAQTVAGTGPGRRSVGDTATFVALQVVGFGLVVILGLVSVGVAARDQELALAKLRGLRGPRLVLLALAEPVLLVLLAVPFGLLLGWGAVAGAAHLLLFPGTPVGLPPEVWWLVGGTVAATVLACAIAARRSVRRPVAEQLRRTSPGPALAGPAATAVLLTLSVVGLVLVITLGRDARGTVPALLTPVATGLTAGVLVGRVVQLLIRWSVARTRGWSLGPYLAVRQLARQASLTQVTALVTVVTAVSGFAAGAYVVAGTQREAQARLDVGAPRVVHVAPVGTADLLEATRQVDPGGSWAMAAVQRGRRSDPLLAVDSARFAVAYPVRGGALARPHALGELVPPDLPEPVTVRGGTATVEVARSDLRVPARLAVGVELRLVTPEGAVLRTTLGRLAAQGGPRTLTAALPACPDGCTVSGVSLTRVQGFGSFLGTVELVSLTAGGRTSAFSLEEWRPRRVTETVPDSVATSTLAGRGDGQEGVVVGFDVDSVATPGIVRRDVPVELPALVGEQTPLEPVGTRQLVRGSTLQGGELPFAVAGRSPVLPRGAGTMVDLELTSRIQPPRDADIDFQVWLGTAAPGDAAEQLSRAGLQVRGVESREARRSELDRAEPARALLLLLVAGVAVLVAGTAGIATVLAATVRRRAVEAAALRALAVPGRVVRGSAVLEDVLLLLPGVLAGGVCAGLLIELLAPVLAEITGASAVVSGSFGVAVVVLPVLATVAVTILLLVPVTLLVTRPAREETVMRVAPE